MKDEGGIKRLSAALHAAGTFSFALHLHADHQQQQVTPKLPAGTTPRGKATAAAAAAEQSAWPWEAYGVAFSVGGGAAWYVPLYKCRSVRRLHELWEGVRSMFECPGLTKVGFAVKPQMKLLAAPPPIALLAKAVEANDRASGGKGVAGSGGGAAGSGGGAAGEGAAGGAAGGGGGAGATGSGAGDEDGGAGGGGKELTPILLADPIVEVRICAWLVQPNDYTWERRSQGRTGIKSLTAKLKDLLIERLESGEKVGWWPWLLAT